MAQTPGDKPFEASKRDVDPEVTVTRRGPAEEEDEATVLMGKPGARHRGAKPVAKRGVPRPVLWVVLIGVALLVVGLLIWLR